MTSFTKQFFPPLPAARRRPWSALWPALFLALLLGLALAPPAARAQTDATAVATATADQHLDGLRKQITAIQTALGNKQDLDDTVLSKMKDDAVAASADATTIATTLTPLLTSVQARLAELGKPAAGVKEAPDVAAQRAQLDRSNAALDAQVKLARLLAVEADQASEQTSTVRRAQLQARLGERTASIMAPQFWHQLAVEWPQNAQRLRAFFDEIGEAMRSTPWLVWLGVLAGTALLAFASVIGGRYLRSLTSTRVPHGRLRRSLHALVLIVVATATPALIAELLKVGVVWGSTLSDKTADFLNDFAGIVAFGGFVAGLGHALLSPGRPSWRLPDLSDDVAQRVRHFPVVIATVMVGVWLAERMSTVVNAGLSTDVAVICIAALLLVGTMAQALWRAERTWRQLRHADTEHVLVAPLWMRALMLVSWLALITSVVSLLIGYVAFGSFIAKQISWWLVVLCATYLLTVVADDICMLLSTTPPNPDVENPVLATPKARDQAAVLLSAGTRTIIVLLALMLLLAPFGEGPSELFRRVGQLQSGLVIGEIKIRPQSVIQALLVLYFGFFGVRLLKQWLEKSYLPTTNLDAGMQLSALTLFGYAGGIVAAAMALSAVGIGLERIAWVASALSVGIGFGLQAVVQNFVSGLIMLAERPVKVGDWVSLGGVEGDIRRINVRATEIQMGDRSTVIVPNSEFITKTVRNVTHASPLGLVQIKLPLPLSTDAEQARTLILGVFADNDSVLDTPAPAVQLDGIDNGYLMFNATGFASSPRLAYGVRSELLFELLKRLRDADMPISKPSTMLLTSAPGLLAPPSPVPVSGPEAAPVAAASAPAAP